MGANGNSNAPANLEEEKKKAHWLVEKCVLLFGSKIFSGQNVGTAHFEPAVTQILIWMHDLLQKADDLGERVSFRDDIPEEQGDVTDLFSKMRNAACHIGSKNAAIDQSVFRFGVVTGKVPNALVVDGQAIGCDYDDDIAVFFGAYRLYLRRHALRALGDIKKVFALAERD